MAKLGTDYLPVDEINVWSRVQPHTRVPGYFGSLQLSDSLDTLRHNSPEFTFLRLSPRFSFHLISTDSIIPPSVADIFVVSIKNLSDVFPAIWKFLIRLSKLLIF